MPIIHHCRALEGVSQRPEAVEQVRRPVSPKKNGEYEMPELLEAGNCSVSPQSDWEPS